MSASDQEILDRLRALLAESDLQTTTEKMLRKKLEEEFKMDMAEKKMLIRQEIERYLAEQGGGESEEEEDEDDDGGRGKASRRSSGLGCLLSEPLAKFLGEETLPRTQVVKRLWDYIKAHNLQDPKDKRKIMLDDKLKTIFTSPLTMFSMNSQLSKHCKTMDAVADDGDRPPRASGGEKRSAPAAAKAKAPEPKAKKAKAEESSGGGGEKKQTGFNKPWRVSAELAEWTGKEQMSRPELTAFFWAYVKEHKLQDPANKSQIVCDEKLRRLSGEERMTGFGFMKHMSKHFLKD